MNFVETGEDHPVKNQPTEDTVRVFNITAKIQVNQPVNRVYLAPDRTDPQYKVGAKRTKLAVPKVEFHCMIVIE